MNSIIEGDAFTVLPSLAPDSVHMIATDPPYFLDGLDTGWRKGKFSKSRSTNTKVGGLPSTMRFDPAQGIRLHKFMAEAGAMMIDLLIPGGFAVVFSQPRLSHRMAVGLEDAGFVVRDMLVWRYRSRAQFKAFSLARFLPGMVADDDERARSLADMEGYRTPQLRPQHELIVLAQKPSPQPMLRNWLDNRTGLMDARESINGKAPTNVVEIDKESPRADNFHPTVKPVRLMEHLIRLFSMPGQVVLDPFCGSGTTCLAAKQAGRGFIGIEVSSEYAEIARGRLECTTEPMF